MNRSMICGLWLMVVLIGCVGVDLGFAVTASWDAVVDPDLQGYKLYRAPGTCATPGAFAAVQTYGLVASGVIPNPATNGTYCHRLTAFNPAGESPFSNTTEFKYVVNPPLAPQGLTVTP